MRWLSFSKIEVSGKVDIDGLDHPMVVLCSELKHLKNVVTIGGYNSCIINEVAKTFEI